MINKSIQQNKQASILRLTTSLLNKILEQDIRR
jgi:hypothetical protein